MSDDLAQFKALKEQIAQERATILDQLKNNEINGSTCARELSDIVDRSIQTISKECFSEFKDHVNIFMAGGNGRQEVFPESDLDLMVTLPNNEPEGFSDACNNFYYAIEAAGYETSSITWCSIAQHKEEAKKDHSAECTRLDRRYIWGSKELFEELNALIKDLNAESPAVFIRDKQIERTTLTAKPGNKRGLYSRSVKEGEGGLRDYQTILWTAQVLRGYKTLEELKLAGFLSSNNLQELKGAVEILQTIRAHLHILPNQKKNNKNEELTPEVLKALSQSMNKSSQEIISECQKARRIIRLEKDIICSALKERMSLGGYHFIKDYGLRFPDNEDITIHDILGIYLESLKNTLPLHHSAKRTIHNIYLSLDKNIQNDPKAHTLFAQILHHPEGGGALRQMQKTGVLQCFLPLYGEIDSLINPKDTYQTYAIDEHGFQALEKVSALEEQQFEENAPTPSELAKALTPSDQKILRTALFLHDAAKGRPGDHLETGAVLVKTYGPLWGLTEEETEKAAWLIKNHNLLSYTSLQKDPSDPATINDLSMKIPSVEHLKLLMVHSTADIMAAGPKIWNMSRAVKMERLYRSTNSFITEQKLEGERAIIIPEEFNPSQSHIEICPIFNDSASQVVIITPDRPHLFEDMAGILSASGNILDLTIDTKKHKEQNIAVQRFTVQNIEGIALEEWQVKVLQESIAQTLSSDERKDYTPEIVQAHKKLIKRNKAFDISPSVTCDNESSKTLTYISVTALNRPGLVYDLAKAFNKHDLKLHHALISTHGHSRAEDFFYVSDENGNKVDQSHFAGIEKTTLEHIRD